MNKTTIIPKQRDIVSVKNNRNYYSIYLVTFVDSNEYFSGYRIFSGKKYANDLNRIPKEYLNSEFDGYVNVFNGAASIKLEYINKAINTLPDEIYFKVVQSAISVLVGNYEVENNGICKLKPMNPVKVTTTVSMEQFFTGLSQPTASVAKKKEKVKDIEIENVNIKEVIERYKTLKDSNDRVNFIFDEFAENGRISPSRVFGIIFKNTQPARKIPKNSIFINKEEFLLIYHQSIKTIESYDNFENYIGDKMHVISKTSLMNIKNIVSSLYSGLYYSKNKSSGYTKDSNFYQVIQNYLNSDMTKEEIIKLHPDKAEKIKDYFYAHNKNAGMILTTKRIGRLIASGDKEISAIGNYLKSHIHDLSLIIEGEITDYPEGIDCDKIIMYAIFCHKSSYYLEDICTKLSDYMSTTEGIINLKGLKELGDTSIKNTRSLVWCSKIKNAKFDYMDLKRSIYGFIYCKSAITKESYINYLRQYYKDNLDISNALFDNAVRDIKKNLGQLKVYLNEEYDNFFSDTKKPTDLITN